MLPFLGGCTERFTVKDRDRLPERIFASQGFEPKWFQTAAFDLRGFVKFQDPNAAWVVYLEGDGYAWAQRYRLSKDPTPYNPVAARLAALDRSPNVLWLARPCQYVFKAKRIKNCNPVYWSSARFSEETVLATQQVIQQVTRGKGVHLVGFSGGAAMAVLASRDGQLNVASLRTLAGNLDHVVLNRHHGVSPLTASLNPVDYGTALSTVPQIHYISPNDKVIVPAVTASWMKTVQRRCARVQSVATDSHSKGWNEYWSSLVLDIPKCQE